MRKTVGGLTKPAPCHVQVIAQPHTPECNRSIVVSALKLEEARGRALRRLDAPGIYLTAAACATLNRRKSKYGNGRPITRPPKGFNTGDGRQSAWQVIDPVVA